MREKVQRLVLAFAAATHAMAAEQYFRQQGIPGRLIPLPGSISAECGLAWSTEPGLQKEMEQLAKNKKIQIQGIYEVMLYERKEIL